MGGKKGRIHVVDFAQLALDWREPLLASAEEVMRTANNYRNYNVGCAMLGINDAGGKRICTGANTMYKKKRYKQCAEALANGSANKHGCHRIVAIAVVGRPQKDSASGHEGDTLHPCEICREMFVDMLSTPAIRGRPELGHILEEEVQIFTRRPESRRSRSGLAGWVDENFTVHELLKLHDTDHPCSYRDIPTDGNLMQ